MHIGKVLTLLERSMNSLVSVTSANFGADRQKRANQVQLRNIKYTPSIQQGILRIECETYSSPSGSGPYTTVVQMHGVKFENSSDAEEIENSENPGQDKYNVFQFTSTDGNTYNAKFDKSNSVDVRVRCGCEDFRWRFAYYNSGDNSLYGDPPDPYVRKTDRPPVNPSNTPGVCKHIMKLKKELEREEFFRALLN